MDRETYHTYINAYLKNLGIDHLKHQESMMTIDTYNSPGLFWPITYRSGKIYINVLSLKTIIMDVFGSTLPETEEEVHEDHPSYDMYLRTILRACESLVIRREEEFKREQLLALARGEDSLLT